MTRNQLGITLALVVSIVGGAAFAEDGVSDSKIVFGQVAALTGPAQDLGQGMRQGVLAAFGEANRNGGISSRTLELELVDDGYEPEKTVVATQKIIGEDKVFAMIGPVGTPTSKASQPIATAAQVPFMAHSPAPNFFCILIIVTWSMPAPHIFKKPRRGSSI